MCSVSGVPDVVLVEKYPGGYDSWRPPLSASMYPALPGPWGATQSQKEGW